MAARLQLRSCSWFMTFYAAMLFRLVFHRHKGRTNANFFFSGVSSMVGVGGLKECVVHCRMILHTQGRIK